MKITKIGHCCLVIETREAKILTDPGAFTVEQNSITGIDVVLITHEHGDHLHVESVKEILKNNPEATIVTNSSVGKILDQESIPYMIIENMTGRDVKGIHFDACDCKHEEIFEEIGQVQNTGYFVDNKLFYPGDSFHNPGSPVEILALPVAGPWCKISDAIRYALAVKPKVAFPVHDGLIKDELVGIFHGVSQNVLAKNNIEFVPLKNGESRDF